MNEQEVMNALDQLANGELEEYRVSKSDFLNFRIILMKREDKKAFRGIAQRGGDVLYKYEPGWTT